FHHALYLAQSRVGAGQRRSITPTRRTAGARRRHGGAQDFCRANDTTGSAKGAQSGRENSDSAENHRSELSACWNRRAKNLSKHTPSDGQKFYRRLLRRSGHASERQGGQQKSDCAISSHRRFGKLGSELAV